MIKVSTFILILVCFVWLPILNVEIVKAENTIYIRSDGSVEGTDNISRDGNVYTFTGNIFGSIFVEKDDVIIYGADFILEGDRKLARLRAYGTSRSNS